MAASLDVERTMTAPVLDAARELAPVIAARAAEIEAARRLPRDLVDDLAAAGCFRMLRPRSHGGHGLDLVAAMQVLEELSRADGSVGWTVGIGSAGWLDLAGLPRDTFDDLFADGDDVIIGGAFNPTGVAVPTEGGYRVSGRWAFASGCEHCHWLFGNCIESDPGASTAAQGTGGDGDAQKLRMAVLSRADVEIQDTWTVSGLCGTGSHHFVADDVFVPAERTYLVLSHEPGVDEPLVRIPLPSPYALLMACVAIGIAQGALDDILGLAASKVPLFAGSPLAANPLFQHQLGTADTQLRAARTLLHDDAETAWATAVDRAPFTPELRARIRAGAAWATATAASVVDVAYTAGGGTSVYATSPLQRRLRDVRAVTQHFLIKPDTLTTAGAVLAGQDVDITFL